MGKNAQRRRRIAQARRQPALEDSLSVGTITYRNRAERRFKSKHTEMAARMAETAARQRRLAGRKPRPRRGTAPWQVAQREERRARKLARGLGSAA